MIVNDEDKPSLDEALAHFGIKGMKWGIRKKEPKAYPREKLGEKVFSQECKNGTQITAYRRPVSEKVQKRMDKDPEYKALQESVHSFIFLNKEGVKVGQAEFMHNRRDTFELEWIDIAKPHRRNGYARAILNGVLDHAAETGVKNLELSSTDMGRPLYESLGFKKDERYSNFYTLSIDQRIKHSWASNEIRQLGQRIARRIDADPDLNKRR